MYVVRAAINQDKLRDQVINKGAQVQADKEVEQQTREKKEWTFMTLRIPTELVLKVDELIKKDPPHSRTSWIINAVRKRLKEDLQ